jgi:superfamily II DNA/RNA helicase
VTTSCKHRLCVRIRHCGNIAAGCGIRVAPLAVCCSEMGMLYQTHVGGTLVLVSDRIRQRLLVEELNRQRRSDDAQRFIEIFRRSTIDPNPHQIEAAMFALRRLSSGGAMLCDEVGLGKTIEAGLVITQLRAEGKSHVLILVPLALAKQWQVELQDLFSLQSAIVGSDSEVKRETRGIFILGREFASGPRGQSWLALNSPWDLVVIDEAHEMFATIHTRFSKRTGEYQKKLTKGGARRAAQIKESIAGSPILLLTATPLQNNLYELWALVHFVDPEQRVLGKFNEFCMLFVTGESGRGIIDEMQSVLRDRLSLVLKRTLRRQAQPFMKQPFRKRHVHTANFSPDRLEIELYLAISKWLSQEQLAGYRSSHRGLMGLQLRRRMASSTEALISTLEAIKQRLLKIQETGVYPVRETEADLELEDLSDTESDHKVDMLLLEQDLTEITRIETLAREALSTGADAKKTKLLEIIRQVQSKALSGVASDKIVIFTESTKTLESLLEFLESHGFKDQVTTFSGSNEGPIIQRAYARWQSEIGQFQAIQPESQATMRGALIREFKEHTSILIATEAGAKGLNLQFCNCLVNYDLPWNPQRIEQRIGRVHRYGQKHDVVIINFINLSNEAEQRVYELLEQKLHVFTSALDASDSVVTIPEIALNLEVRLNEMLDRCRTQEEIQRAFDKLSLELDEAQRRLHDEKLVSSRQLLSEFDESLQARLGQLEDSLGSSLSRCDKTLLEILSAESQVEIVGTDGPRTVFRWNDALYHLGPPNPGPECGEPLYKDHPRVQAVIARCISATEGKILETESESSVVGKIYRIQLRGIEEEERVLIVGREAQSQGATHCAVDLEAGILEMKLDAERRDRTYVDRLLAQLASRRQDLQQYGVTVIAEMQKKLTAAERARRLATSSAASAKAQAQQRRLQSELEKLRTETAGETKRRLLELDNEERRVRRLQFVEVTAALLFEIEYVTAPGRTIA